jgi:CubicO group peptidase (beta-lactamase class C family)
MSRKAIMLACAAVLSLTAATAHAQIPREHVHPDHAPANVPPWTVPSDEHIRAVLANLVDRQHVAPGMVIGIIEPTGRRIIAYGVRDASDPRPVDGDTLFELGSITKLFTALLLSDMVGRGEVALDEPAQQLAPPGMVLPERDGRKITLLDLVTHTAGLPNFPPNREPRDPLNPFAEYSEAKLQTFLDSYRLERSPGGLWRYSSLGVGLLGDLLARREGMTYEAAVTTRVLTPLHLNSTSITLTPAEASRLSPGHRGGVRAPNWDVPLLAGASALKSSANDMLTFLSAELGYEKSPLSGPMAAMLTVRRPTDWPSDAQAVGWLVSQTSMGEVVHHEGETAGYRTYIAYDPVRRTGIVVLANSATNVDLGDVGDRILIGTVRS